MQPGASAPWLGDADLGDVSPADGAAALLSPHSGSGKRGNYETKRN